MPKFKFGAEINFCGEYGLEPNFVLDFVPKLTFGAEVTSVPKLLVPNIDRLLISRYFSLLKIIHYQPSVVTSPAESGNMDSIYLAKLMFTIFLITKQYQQNVFRNQMNRKSKQQSKKCSV